MSRRFFVEKNSFTANELLTLSAPTHAEELKHLVKVLRYGVGDEILLTNGFGQEARAKIISLTKDSAQLEILSVSTKKKSHTRLSVCQAVLKGPKMDWLVEKATELGVHKLIPIISDFTIAASEQSAGREERWKRISTSAVKQSGAGQLLNIPAPESLSHFLDSLPPNACGIVLEPDPSAQALFWVVQKALQTKPIELFVFIGPEGGWSHDELKLLHLRPFHFAHLGENILRGETAAICASSIALHAIDFPTADAL